MTVDRSLRRTITAAAAALWCLAMPASAEEPTDLQDAVTAGTLPALAQRLPENPRIVDMASIGKTEGRYGGTIRMIMADAKDIRMMTIYGYSRLVAFDKDLNLVPDILESFDVQEGRIFTLHLRPGHKWSDGAPFTTEDFRYFWEDVAMNEELSRGGPDQQMLVDGKPPKFEVIDELTVRYTWDKPNPLFLPSLAGASPNFIYLPAHYMKQFHKSFADPDKLAAAVASAKSRDWVALHTVKARQYRPENPDLPTLDPWTNTTPPPAERFVFKRNPYFHRVDASGRQLPYVDTVFLTMSSSDIIAAKTGSGESDLQGRYLRFDNYTFLKQGEKTHPIKVKLWKDGTGSRLAFLPNLNTNDAVWREIFRNVDFRRALSLGINRAEINQQFFYGLAHEGANSVLQSSPLYNEKFDQAWAAYDPEQANALLDKIGLKRNDKGTRVLPDGRPAELIVEFGGDSQETDIIELVREHWGALGIKVYSRAYQLDTMRRRFLAGDTLISVWSGLSVGEATADLPPEELAPVSGVQGNWPKWGEYTDSAGKGGEAIDLPEAQELLDLYQSWRVSATTEERREIWRKMLEIFTDQVFTIGTVNNVRQPIVINSKLQNVPEEGIYAFAPSAYFGIYMPDTFWYADKE